VRSKQLHVSIWIYPREVYRLIRTGDRKHRSERRDEVQPLFTLDIADMEKIGKQVDLQHAYPSG
jgi:hypothetical protein